MKLPRRRFLHLAAGAAALPAVSRIARAQAYPAKPVRIIVGFAAGGPTDILARLIGQRLSDRLGQPFIIENRVGSSGNLATEAVLRGAADGYTLLVVPTNIATNATIYDKLNYIRELTPVASFISVESILVVNPSVPVATVPEFIAYAKANPGELNMASPGNGTVPHVSGELFKMMTGVDMVHVPYRGIAPALTDLISGQVHVMFAGPVGMIQYIHTAKLRALAVTSAFRSKALPDLPTIGDFVPGYEATSWYGMVAPRGTPADVVVTLNKEINTALADPTVQARLADFGGTVLSGSPIDFGKLIAADTEKWGKVIRTADIKPE
jgi:tripartite-type tricarboxylate transporter receptor subunit TctC